MVQDPVVSRCLAYVFPGLVLCSVSLQRPTTAMLPHSHPRSSSGPSAIVTWGTRTEGKFSVPPGVALATPSKQQGIPPCKMAGGEPVQGHAYADRHKPLCFIAGALHGRMPWMGERLLVVAYSGALRANLAPANMRLLQDSGFRCV